jgi:hypothetical protein
MNENNKQSCFVPLMPDGKAALELLEI